MNKILAQINQLIKKAEPDNYSSISYNKYFRDLADLSDAINKEKEILKEEINELDIAVEIKNKFLNLL